MPQPKSPSLLGWYLGNSYKFRSRTRASRFGSFSSAIAASFSVLCGYCHLFFICQQMGVVKFFGFDACMPWFVFVAVLFLLAELECSLFLVCWKCVLSCYCWVLEVVTEFLWNLCFGFEICAVVLEILWSFWPDLDLEVLDVIFGFLILFLDYDIVHTCFCFLINI